MRASRILIVFAMAGFAASAALADGVDPGVVIRKVDPAPIAITSPTQTFPVSATATNNIFAFQNDTGVTLKSLILDLLPGKSGLTYSCGDFAGGGVFAHCTSTPEIGGDTVIDFFGIDALDPGIAAATCTPNPHADGDGDRDDMPICKDGVYSLEFIGIPRGATVTGSGTVSAPEPMTAVMLVSGLLGLAGLRKRRVS